MRSVSFQSLLLALFIVGSATINLRAEESSDQERVSEAPSESVGHVSCMRTCLDDGEDPDVCRESCVQIVAAPGGDTFRVACR